MEKEALQYQLLMEQTTEFLVQENIMILLRSLQKNTAPGWWILKAEKKRLT